MTLILAALAGVVAPAAGKGIFATAVLRYGFSVFETAKPNRLKKKSDRRSACASSIAVAATPVPRLVAREHPAANCCQGDRFNSRFAP